MGTDYLCTQFVTYSTDLACPALGILCAQKKPKLLYHLTSFSFKDHDRLSRAKNRYMLLHCENNTRRRDVQLLISAKNPTMDDSCARDFPRIVKDGSQVKVENWKEKDYKKLDSGIIYRDIKVGNGGSIDKKEQVSLEYNIYNQSCVLTGGKKIDGFLGQLIDTLDSGSKVGFEEGIKGMKSGGQRMIIIPGSDINEYRVFDIVKFLKV